LPRLARRDGKIAAMNRFLLTLALLGSSASGLLAAESPKRTIDLFGGHDLAKWELVTLPATPAEIAAVCTFNADGSLAVAGKPVSYLTTKTAYENFRLHAEWRWPKDAVKNSNGGVLLHISTGPTNNTAWPVCFQMQLKLGRAGDILPMNGATFIEKLSTAPGAITPQLNRAAESSETPLGEWNMCDIVCRSDAIEVTINGILQNRVTRCVPMSGRIGFQLEGMPFELRNVRLEPLPPAIGSSYQAFPAKY
jgi:hypothetical protein